MPGFDERLTRELERAARPAAPDPVTLFDDVARRRTHRSAVRKAQVVTSVVVVLALVAGAVLWLAPRFSSVQPAAPTGDGTLIFERIAFPGGATTSWWSVAPDGTRLAPLPAPAFGPNGATYGASPAVSPDGSRFAYLSTGNPTRMMIADADGSDAHAVGGETFYSPWFEQPGSLVRWSPDGSQVAFAEGPNNIDTETTQKPVAGIPMNDIRVVDATTGEGRTIQMPARGIMSFDWSPDGSSFVVATLGTKDLQGDIEIVGLDGHVVRRLTTRMRAMAPAWSPDGSTIAFLALSTAPRGGRDVWTVPATGGTPTRVTDSAKTGASALGVAWSPDGTGLAYAWANLTEIGGTPTPDVCGISVLTPDGAPVRQIGNQDTFGGCPRSLSWGPTPNMGPQVPYANPGLLQWRPVMEISRPGSPAPSLTCAPASCTATQLQPRRVVLRGANGALYTLGPTIVDGNAVVAARSIGELTPGFVYLAISLDENGTAAFARATRHAVTAPPPQNEIAIVWDGQVVSAPTVQAVLTQGQLELSFPSGPQADAVLAALPTGNGSSP